MNDKLFKDLEPLYQNIIENTVIPAIIIKKGSPELKYEIFARLNLGATPLNQQELRNCLYRGSFNDMLEDIAANNPYLIKMFSSENKRKSFQEYILRFYALRDYNNYKSSMVKTLNQYIIDHQNDSPESLEEQKALFANTIDIVKQVLGDSAFKQYDRKKNVYTDKFLVNVYDSIIIPFSLYDKHVLMKYADEIRNQINDLRKTSEEYSSYSEKSTSTKKAVRGRIKMVNDIIYNITKDECITSKRIFDKDVKEILWNNDSNHKCSYCGNTILSIDDAEVDHINPFSLGGDTDLSNAQLLHRHCNREKSNSIDNDDWAENEDTFFEE